MTNIIGFNGTAKERHINWRILRDIKEQNKFFKDNPDRFDKALKKNKKIYKKIFEEYIGKAA
jgi:thiamine kinase-like enzyme